VKPTLPTDACAVSVKGIRFKISKKSGAYRCFTNFCSPDKIRKIISPNFVPTPKAFTYQKPRYTGGIKELISPIPLDLKNATLARTLDYHRPVQRGNRIYYYYDQYRRLERIEQPDGKKIFPQYYAEGKWAYGVDGQWQAYCPVISASGNIFLGVEGEKTVHSCLEQGYAAFTIPMHCWGEDALYPILRELKEQYQLSGILYCHDADTPGLLKAKAVVKQAWKLGISATYINTLDLLSEDQLLEFPIQEGLDLADIFSKFPRFNLEYELSHRIEIT
jgi:hypothetical protein